MNTPQLTDNPVHDEVSKLLPWYVNGTLRGSEKVSVEEHVRNCTVCRRELAFERRTLETFRNDSRIDHSARAGFERLQALIADTERASGRNTAGIGGFPWRWSAHLARHFSLPRFQVTWFALPVAVAVLAVGLLTVLPTGPGFPEGDPAANEGQRPGAYRTLSNARSAVPNNNDIHIVFARNTGSESISELLQSLQAEVIAGPNSAGAYTIRLSGRADEAQRQAAIMALRTHGDIVFAEAAQPLAVP